MNEKLELANNAFLSLKAKPQIVERALANLKEWLQDERLVEYHPYIDHLIENERWEMLLDSFWRMIPFGTGGRRGPVGAGPNRINPHTISLSVQGHCEYLRDVVGITGDICVVVAHDVRQFFDLRGAYTGVDGLLNGLTSLDMARISAMTYAANGITAYVVGSLQDGPNGPRCTDRFISTPELSFLIRELGAAGGLNISASHNHPDDNGGKFYNRQGGQEIPPDDEALLNVVKKVKHVKTMAYDKARDAGLILTVPPEQHRRYIQLNMDLSFTDSRSASVAFTPLCGTGMTTVHETLTELGFRVVTVPEQSAYDGSFAPVRYRIANPEVPDSMDELEKVARENDCHVGFSTDPDADRLGMIVPEDGGYRFVNGNEIGLILIESIVTSMKRANTLPSRPVFINTVVTSSLQREIARRYGCQVIGDLMVGFKYMGDVMGHLDLNGRFPPDGDLKDRDSIEGTIDDFVFTTEESHGYLLTPRIRDKDACGAAVHLAGLASTLVDDGSSFLQMLRDIYRVYGYHRNVLRSLVMEGIVGLERIKKIQDVLRGKPPVEIAGRPVTRFVDNHVVGGPMRSTTDRASRDVLMFELDSGDGRTIRLVVRPSGTEPKTKIYVEVPSVRQLGGTLDEATGEKLAQISDDELDEIIARADGEATQIGNEFIRFCLGPQVLGDVYPTIPDESLLVSDLVPVDHKVRLCTQILPKLVDDLVAGVARQDIADEIDRELRSFGEDPRGLVRNAAAAWFGRKDVVSRLDESALAFACGLFD